MGVEWLSVAAAVLPQSFKILMDKSPLRFFIPLRLASLMLSHSDRGVEWLGVAVAVLPQPFSVLGKTNLLSLLTLRLLLQAFSVFSF